jgi:hypothetical protein
MMYDKFKENELFRQGTSYFTINKLTTQRGFFTTTFEERDRMVRYSRKPRTEALRLG